MSDSLNLSNNYDERNDLIFRSVFFFLDSGVPLNILNGPQRCIYIPIKIPYPCIHSSSLVYYQVWDFVTTNNSKLLLINSYIDTKIWFENLNVPVNNLITNGIYHLFFIVML